MQSETRITLKVITGNLRSEEGHQQKGRKQGFLINSFGIFHEVVVEKTGIEMEKIDFV